MSRIKSKGNRSTELALVSYMRRWGITGWRRHIKVQGIDIDFIFPKTRTAVFVDGCFWHGCERHCNLFKLPVYWSNKIKVNMMRDVKQGHVLRRHGWRVRRLWEHDLKGVSL